MNGRDRYPRTLQEAFGPYTSADIEDPDQSLLAHEIALFAVSALAIAVVAVVLTLDWLA